MDLSRQPAPSRHPRPRLRRPPGAARGVAALLVDPHFGGVFWGKFFSFAAVMVYALVVSILAFQAVGSTLAVALVNAAMFAPQLVLGPWSGAAADRGLGVVQIVAGRALSGVGAGVLAVWILTVDVVNGWGAVMIVAASAAVSGIGLAVSAAAMNSLVPQLVSRSELPLAMSLNTVPISVARVTGPAFGAFVLAASGTVVALWWAAAGHFVFSLVVLGVRPPAGMRRPRTPDGSVGAAWSYVARRDRTLLRLLVAVTFVGFGSEPVFILAPSYAAGFGGGAALVGMLSASFGLGAALGLLLSMALQGRRSHAQVSLFGFLLMAVGTGAAAGMHWLLPAAVSFGVIGLGFTLALAGVSTLLQLRVPDELRGRVMGLWMIGLVGVRPVTALLVGVAADLLSDRASFLAVAFVTLAAAWWCRPSRLMGDGGNSHQLGPGLP